MYDIVILGSGPAGSTLARLIGNKYKVLIMDKRDLQDERQENSINKCCGGLLSPDAQKMIAKLGLGMPQDILVHPQLFAVRTIDLTNDLEGLYQRFYLNMDREKFDRWLVSLIPDNVDKSFNSLFKSYKQISNGYELTCMQNGKELKIETKAIIGADGANSRIRNSLGKIAVPDTYIAIQEWYKCSSSIPYYTAIFDEEISDFYSWIIPKNDCILLGSPLKPKDNPKEKFNKLKSKLTQKGFCFDKKVKTEGSFIYRPKKLSNFYVGKDNIALIGEAAGAISPSSAEGISYAMKTALYLSESLELGLDGFLERYKKKANISIYPNLLIKNLKSPAMYNPHLRKLAITSGLGTISTDQPVQVLRV